MTPTPKERIVMIFTQIIFCAILFMAWAFVNVTVDITKWTEGARAMYVFVCFGSVIINIMINKNDLL